MFTIDELVVIDSIANTVVSRVTIAKEANGLTVHPDGTRVYVVSGDDDGSSVAVVDSRSNAVTATIPIDGYASVLGSTFISPQTQSNSDAGGCAIDGNSRSGSGAFFVPVMLCFVLLGVRAWCRHIRSLGS